MQFPLIMGILNITPDSFSDGGLFISQEAALEQAFIMASQGAEIIDIGGESTRPGSEYVEESEEIDRVIPIIQQISKQVPNVKISIDTRKYNVAKLAIESGAKIINDVSGLDSDQRLAELAAENNAELIIMHKKGDPVNMQANPKYNNLLDEIYSYLKEKSQFAIEKGVSKVIVDVGIGFGKNYDDNLTLLKNIDKFSEITGYQLLGISRKSFIGKMLDIDNPRNRDIATAILHTILINRKITHIRVHNTSIISQIKKISKIFG